MYIKINEDHYPCTGYAPKEETVIFSGVEGLVLPISGAITLCTDEGFELAAQEAVDYARQTLEGNVLTLTNLPEPEPIPEPEPEAEPQPTAQEDTNAMLIDHEYRLTLMELGV